MAPFGPLQIKKNVNVYKFWDPYNYILSTKFHWFCKSPTKSANIYSLQPLNVKRYCNHDRGSEDLLLNITLL